MKLLGMDEVEWSCIVGFVTVLVFFGWFMWCIVVPGGK